MEVRKEAITIQDVFRNLEVLCSKTLKKNSVRVKCLFSETWLFYLNFFFLCHSHHIWTTNFTPRKFPLFQTWKLYECRHTEIYFNMWLFLFQPSLRAHWYPEGHSGITCTSLQKFHISPRFSWFSLDGCCSVNFFYIKAILLLLKQNSIGGKFPGFMILLYAILSHVTYYLV